MRAHINAITYIRDDTIRSFCVREVIPNNLDCVVFRILPLSVGVAGVMEAAINIAVRRLNRHLPPGSIFPSPATSTRIVLMGDVMRTRLVVVVFVALIPALCFN